MKNDKKRICFVHIGMQRDGAERVIAKLANKYADDGYYVDIVVLLIDGCGYQLNENVRIISFVRNEYSRPRNLMYWIKGIRKHIKDTKPEHVISFSMYVNIIVILACLGLKKDILISERNDPSSDGRSWVDIALTYILYPFANKIVFQTKRAKACYPKYIREKSQIIYNPVNVTTEACHIKKNEKKIVTVGRLEPQKNQRLLIQAMRDVIQEYQDCYLEIFGEGSLRDNLIGLVNELGLDNKISFMGNVSNIHERIADSSIFVLSSDYEGMSNALLEAMMMGLPCISTNCAGSDEIIKNGYNGILVPVGDQKAMSAAILGLLNDEELAKKIGKNANRSSELFSGNTVLKKWFDYIDK